MWRDRLRGNGGWIAGVAAGVALLGAGMAVLTALSGRSVDAVTVAAPIAPAPPEVAPPVKAPSAEPEPAAPASTVVGEAVERSALNSAAKPVPPVFDTVRVEPDGSTLVAGQSLAGGVIQVLLDGAQVFSGPVDGTGNFAALFDLPPSDQPRLMTLTTTLPDGRIVASADSVAIAPTAAPLPAEAVTVIADAEPAADTPPAADAGPPATLLVTDAGGILLQSDSAADIQMPVSIDTISYAPDGAVQLSGVSGAGAMLRLYLDNAEVMTLEAPPTGPWAVTLPDVAPGLYTLRVDQLDDAGKVTSRFETPFRRETPEALAAVSAEPPVAEVAMAEPEPEPTLVPEPPPVDVVAEPDPATPDAALAAAPAAAPMSAAPITVTVQPGFTLWKIARESYGDGVMYVQVFDANRDKIRNPDLIYPGQVFTMPAMP